MQGMYIQFKEETDGFDRNSGSRKNGRGGHVLRRTLEPDNYGRKGVHADWRGIHPLDAPAEGTALQVGIPWSGGNGRRGVHRHL